MAHGRHWIDQMFQHIDQHNHIQRTPLHPLLFHRSQQHRHVKRALGKICDPAAQLQPGRFKTGLPPQRHKAAMRAAQLQRAA